MSSNKKAFTRRRKVKAAGILCLLALFVCVITSFLLTRIAFSAGGVIVSSKPTPQPVNVVATVPESTPLPSAPRQPQVSRIKAMIRETKDFPFPAGLNSAVVVSPEIASVQIKNHNTLTITAIEVGETILIVNAGQYRQTFIIEVLGKTFVPESQNLTGAKNEKPKTSGSYSMTYVHGFDGNPSFLRQNIEFRRKLSDERTLRVSGEMFKLMDNTGRDLAFARAPDFGLDRLSVGVDSADKTIDFLDSQLNISPRSFNNFTMRGFHLVETSKSSPDTELSSNGIEIFAGLARPSHTLYDNDWGKLAGLFLPVASGPSWKVRAGLVTIVPQTKTSNGRGGTALQLIGSYAPGKKFSADGEVAYANGGVSWRARLELKLKQLGATGEITRFDKNSPLNSIGAQPGGFKAEEFSFYWRPDQRFNFSAGYNHSEVSRLINSRLADFDRSTFFAHAGYKIGQNSRVNLHFLDQRIETAVPESASKFQIETRSLTISNDHRFDPRWTNYFEGRINLSREAGAGADLEKGFDLREQLQFSWRGGSVTGFLNYTHNTPTLTSLIVRNPQILPPLLQTAFTLDPAAFLQAYRDRLGFLLNGIDLPQTRSLGTGLRFQTTISRFTLVGETRYGTGEMLSGKQHNLFAMIGLNIRLDAANSLRISGRQSFGVNRQPAITFSFTHRFGAGSGEGFQFSKLFGFNKGRIQGRVYYDLNGNGQDDQGEPGVAGMTVQLNENRSVKTDSNGRYKFSAKEGRHDINLVSDELGVRLLANTATSREESLYERQTLDVSFGVIDFGFVGGRIVNGVGNPGETVSSDLKGLAGVRVITRGATGAIFDSLTNGNGFYEVRNLRPGNYTLEIDPATVPPNFRVPTQTSWTLRVDPLRSVYFDISIDAHRAVAGTVFIDNNGDGRFNPGVDEPVAGAYVISNGNIVAVSAANGAYILRNLAAGKIMLNIRSPQGKDSVPIVLEFGTRPETKRVNLAIKP